MKDKYVNVPLFYAGNSFRLRRTVIGERWRFYTITAIEMGKSTTLRLPEEHEGLPIRGLSLGREEVLPSVHTLVLSATLSSLTVSNKAFPSLKRVEVPKTNASFSTDGKRIYDGMGRKLLYSFAINPEETFILPHHVVELAKGCFADTLVEEIQVSRGNLEVDEGAFDRSAFLAGHSYLATKDCLCALLKPEDTLVLGENIKKVGAFAFSLFVPRVISCENVPVLNGLEIQEMASGEVEELWVRGTKEEIWVGDVLEWESLLSITVPENHALYESHDGVLYRKEEGGLSLFAYPRGRREREYRVCTGTLSVLEKAFSEATYLEQVWMPDSVTSIAKYAFYGARSLRNVRLSSGLLTIGDRAFYQTAIQELSLPDGLLYVEEGAFFDCIAIRAKEGSAKNLVMALMRERQDNSGAVIYLEEDKEEREKGTLLSAFYLPYHISKRGLALLCKAWDAASFQVEGPYAEAFLEVKDHSKEKLGMALQVAWWAWEEKGEGKRIQEADGGGEEEGEARTEVRIEAQNEGKKREVEAEAFLYLRGQKDALLDLLFTLPEADFAKSLSLPIFEKEDWGKLLSRCNERGDSLLAAWVLEKGAGINKGEDFAL